MFRLFGACAVATLAGFIVSLGSDASEAASPGAWVVRDLGTVAGLSSSAVDVNERGQVVANAASSIGAFGESSGDESHAFLWERGRITPLGDLGGNYTVAVAINDRGEIVGSSRTRSGERHAFLWRRGHMIDLGTLPGHTASFPAALDNRGNALVNSYVSELAYPWQGRAFLWQSGTRRALGSLPGAMFAVAVAMNERGRVVGLSGSKTAYPMRMRGFSWEAGHMTELPTPRGRFLSPGYPHALAVNAAGHVAATFEDSRGSDRRAVLWRTGGATVLGEGIARAIDDRGHVVFGSRLWWRGKSVDLGMAGLGINGQAEVIGWRWTEWRRRSDPQSQECARAAVWRDGHAVELGALHTTKPCNVPPYVNTYAAAINDAGLIVGYSGSGIRYRAVLWAPVG